jgi:alkanesulfonate monooxygenase SsuD/methylene tetrahydromethanopterin reductase-like flavin-dependent oxidoreductase (luciferase family)
MRFGFVLPFGDARDVAELGRAAEAAGWDGIFVWEAVWGVDAWVALTAVAMVTERLRLGTMLTPLPRVRPWDLASRVGTLDRLSAGRVQLAVGLGALHDGWTAFEVDQGRATRARLLDEGLDVYAGLMHGQPFHYDGEHYQVRPTDFMVPDPPVQQPHPPVWVVGAARTGPHGLVSTPSLERAARWEGLVPNVIGDDGAADAGSPDTLAELVALARAHRQAAGLSWDGYDVVVEGRSHGEDRTRPGDPAEWAAAGGTWWVEGAWDLSRGPEGRRELDRRIAAGPPGRTARRSA